MNVVSDEATQWIWGKRVRTLHFECSLKPGHSVLSASQCSKISVHSVLSALGFLCFTVHWRVHAALCVVWAHTCLLTGLDNAPSKSPCICSAKCLDRA